MPLNILEISDSRKEKIARSAAGIEGRMCKSRFLSGDENNVSQTTQIYIKEFAIWERSDREAAVLIILLAWSGMIERIRSENVLRWQNELGRKREVEEPSFLGCSPSYMVGVSNKLSGDPVVCSFIMISTRLSILSSPPLSSISFPLFVLCFALFHASTLFSFISPFSFFFVSSLSQFLSCMHKRSRVFWTRIVSLTTYNIKSWNVIAWSFMNRIKYVSQSRLFPFVSTLFFLRNETSATNNFSRCVALFPFSRSIAGKSCVICRASAPRGF